MEAKATAKFVRSSARKARVVIDLIRGKDVDRAREILQFCDRVIAEDVSKVLESAVANAAQQDMRASNLYVKATYADEGPTMKRYRPRAKGSASRINKRMCHITVVVAPREEA